MCDLRKKKFDTHKDTRQAKERQNVFGCATDFFIFDASVFNQAQNLTNQKSRDNNDDDKNGIRNDYTFDGGSA